MMDKRMKENCTERDLIASEGDGSLEPYVGMEFESHEEARLFYNAYARQVGFGTRINYSHRSQRDRSLIAQQYVCDKEGFRVNKGGMKKRHRADTRVGCKALMTMRKICPGRWVVKHFEKDHNHALLSSTKVQFLRSHRLNASMNNNVFMPGMQFGSPGDISFNEHDCVDYAGTVRQRNFARGDTQVLLNYLKRMQNENSSFFYAVQVDKEDRVINALWVDTTARMAYDYFGDVVTFDTTYFKSKHHLPFAPFVGVNHHGLPVLFGFALLLDETKSSFVWLFKTWLGVMCERHPISIITDQDRTIQAAVAEVFPKTRHRFCMLHIQRKLLDKFANICSMHKNFKEEFQKCIYHSETTDEFETRWDFLLDIFDLRKNDWLQLLYEDRRFWVPVYLKDIFLIEMPTVQQSEIIISFFDGYMSAHTTTLQEFVMQYDNALNNLYYKEAQADFETMNSPSNYKTSSPMEKQAASVFTREIFKKFQVELFESFGYVANKITEDGTIDVYKVAKFGDETKAQTVVFNVSETRGSCSCQMFEHTGILCRHVLNVFKVENVFLLPTHYILKRWTRNAKDKVTSDECSNKVQGNFRQSIILRYNDLCQRSIKIVEEGAKSIESYNVAVRALQGILEEVVSVNDNVAKYTKPSSLVSEGGQDSL